MQRRLLAFIAAVRAQDPRLDWRFDCLTLGRERWTEHDLATRGMPPTWLLWLHASVNLTEHTAHTTGCFSAARSIRPRAAARQPQREAAKINPAYYLRFCKSFGQMGVTMHYVQDDNVAFLHNLLTLLQ
jgi:hypothetical protein